MAEVKATTKRIGGSIAVFIPAEVARAEGLREGQVVYLTVRTGRRRAGNLVGKYKGIGVRAELRKAVKDASFADAVVLSVARNREAVLVSGDAAFQGQRDVVTDV